MSRSGRIFVIDKTPPEIAWLNETHSAALNHPKVVYQSANLITQSEFFMEEIFNYLSIHILLC